MGACLWRLTVWFLSDVGRVKERPVVLELERESCAVAFPPKENKTNVITGRVARMQRRPDD